MEYSVKKLSGIPVIFAPLADAQSTTIEIIVNAGSVYEDRNTNGISHFLEHMFFKGGERYTTPMEVANAIDTIGGEFNAYTGDEYAGYYVKCAPYYINVAIDVLSDMLVNATFPEQELEKEKGVIIQEIMMYKDEPRRNVLDKWQRYFYGDNNYGWSTIGSKENVLSFNREDFIRHKEGLYTKDNMVIAIAGGIPDQAVLEAKVASLFADLPEHATIKKAPYVAHTPEESIKQHNQGTQQNHLVIGAEGYTNTDSNRFAAKLLGNILGGSMSSRLFHAIREQQGLCYYIHATHYADLENGAFLIRAGIEKDRWDFGVEAIYKEIKKLVTEKIPESEYLKALGNLSGKTQMGIETSDQLTSFLGVQYLQHKKIHTLERILEQYKAVTIEQLHNVAQSLAKDKLYMYYIQ